MINDALAWAGAVGGIVGMACFSVVSIRAAKDRSRRLQRRIDDLESEIIQPKPTGLDVEVPPIDEPVDDQPRVFDPDNPPRTVTYMPKGPGGNVHCTCHDRRVYPGDTVMLWPIPKHPQGGMDVLCAQTIGETP